MGADVLATQGARASATMIFTMLNQIDLVSARQGLIDNVDVVWVENYVMPQINDLLKRVCSLSVDRINIDISLLCKHKPIGFCLCLLADIFDKDQLFLVFEFEDAGCDLEGIQVSLKYSRVPL